MLVVMLLERNHMGSKMCASDSGFRRGDGRWVGYGGDFACNSLQRLRVPDHSIVTWLSPSMRFAAMTAWVRLPTASFCRMAETWALIVASEMPSWKAICLLSRPSF